jgi:hypothetical protein
MTKAEKLARAQEALTKASQTVTSTREVDLSSGGQLSIRLVDAYQLTESPEDRAFLEQLLTLIEDYENQGRDRAPAPDPTV